MPPKTKTDAPVEPTEAQQIVAEALSEEPAPARPAHASELCSACGVTELDPSATVWGCEHGTWTL